MRDDRHHPGRPPARSRRSRQPAPRGNTIRFGLSDPEFAEEIPHAIMRAAAMVASGEVTVPVAAIYPLEEIGAAIAHQARGGKILLKVGG